MNDIDLPAPEASPVQVTSLHISVGDWMAILTNLFLAQCALTLLVSVPCFVFFLIWIAIAS